MARPRQQIHRCNCTFNRLARLVRNHVQKLRGQRAEESLRFALLTWDLRAEHAYRSWGKSNKYIRIFKGLRRTTGRRPKGGQYGDQSTTTPNAILASLNPILTLSLPYIAPGQPMLTLFWPLSALCGPCVDPMFGLCWAMSTLCWPELALSCPYVAYVGPLFPQGWPCVGPMLAHVWALSLPYVGPRQP